MSEPRVEHVNVTVSDVERASALMQAVFDWKERWRGQGRDGGWTVHVGSDTSYLALWSPADGGDGAVRPFLKGAPLNHVGVVVDDMAETERRVVAQGLRPFNHADYEPGRRFYFLDPDGVEYEVVSYA